MEQFGYGFGFTAYMVYMLMVASGPDGHNPHKTAHYALCTGFMALGMMLPGMWCGLAAGAAGLPELLHLGLHRHAAVVRGRGVDAHRPGVRPA